MDISWTRLCMFEAPQAIGAGVCLIRHGVILLKRGRSTDEGLIADGRARKLAAVALLIGGTVSMCFGAEYFVKTSRDALVARFFVDNQNSVEGQEDLTGFDLYEEIATREEEFPQSLLFLSVGHQCDFNGAQNPMNMGSAFRKLSDVLGVRYRVIFDRFQICSEIQKASMTSSLEAGLVLGGHGNSHMMRLSLTKAFVIFDFLPRDCFKGLSENARIFIKSCNTGKNSWLFPNFAEWLSWTSGREVVAATCRINSIEVLTTRAQYREQVFENNTHLDIRLLRRQSDCTAFFNTSTVWTEKAVFFVKVANIAVVEAILTWQALRLSASVLKGSGAATLWLVDKSAPPIKKIAQLVGCYDSRLGSVFYHTTKIAGSILNVTGSKVHQGMDNTVNWIFRKGSDSVSYIVSTIFGRCRRTKLNLNHYNKEA